jgi:flavin-dependent dehydrogenase
MREGAKYYYSTTVDEIRGTSDQVKLFSTAGQSRVNFSSRVAVIACGISPSLVQSAGLGLIRDYAQGAQTEVACKGVSEVEVYSGSQIAPGFFAWLVPTGDGYAKAGLLCQGNPKLHIERLLKHLEQQGKIADVNSLVWYGAVPLKPLQKTYSDRLIVVGDAAGQVKPTTGGGIYFGILCARIAASTLHGALTGDDLSARRLSAYQKEWHKLLKRELSIDYWALQFYRKLTDAQIEYIFGIIERHAIHESILASPDITFDWHSNVILDAIKYGSLQRALARLSMKPPPLC